MNSHKFKNLFVISISLFLQMQCFFVTPCLGQDAPVTYSNFTDYMTNRTWIKEMTFDLSRKTEGFTTLKASLQPSGMFFQYLTNSPYHYLYVFGESEDEYWQTTPTVIDVAMKKPEMGGSESNRLQTICQTRKRQILYVLNIGIDGLDNQNIKWLSQNEFTSPLLDWLGEPTSGKIDVKIESFYEGLPDHLECEITGIGHQHLQIFCRYASAVLPPSEVDIKKTAGGKVSFLTNIIQNISFGLRDDAIHGFMPTNFFLGKHGSATLEIESNGFAYAVHTNGTLQLISKAKTFPKEEMSRTRNVVIIRIILVAFMILPLVALLYKAINGKMRKQN
jgi:hypothetical protein